jgi:preflagellin peptidase FlaK
MIVVLIPVEVAEFLILNYGVQEVIFSILQFAGIFVLSYALYYLGAYGGADAKAFLVISLTFPIYPQFFSLPLINRGFGIFAFSTLSNSVIAAPFMVISIFIRNLIKEGLKNLKSNIFYYFIAYRVDASSIPKFHNVLEYLNSNGKLVRVRRGIEPDDELLYRLKKAYAEGKIDKVWVTPGLPFLIFITAGFIISVIFGDILYELVRTIFL